MGGGTGYYENIWYKGLRYSSSPMQENRVVINDKIDEILAGQVVAPPPPPPPPPPNGNGVIEVTTGPDLGWLQGIADWFGNLVKWYQDRDLAGKTLLTDAVKTGNYSQALASDRQSLATNAINSSLEGLGPSISGAVFGELKSISDPLAEALSAAGQSTADQVMAAMSPHSPDPALKAKVEELVKKTLERQKDIIGKIHKSPADPEGAPNASAVMAAALIGVQLTVEVAGAVLDLLHPLKKVGAKSIAERLVDHLSIGKTIENIFSLPADVGLIPPLLHYYNSLYQPNIPSYQDLVNMRVKEKITQPEFEQNLAYQGYSPLWAGKIWDAHFIPPSLNDFITAWRRGLITETQLDEYMILVDLDPLFKSVFDTRKYVTPTLSLARYMFETGAIDAAKVEEIVRLEGYGPEYAPHVTNFIVGFQGRRWRTRYLQALATGFVRGVRTEENVHTAVLEAGYTEDVAKWLIESSKVRLDIEKAKGTGGAAKLLSEGELKRLYAKNHLSADQLRTELQLRGYSTGDVDLLIVMLDEEKVVVSAGGTKVALSVPELLSAMRFGIMTEDAVSVELQLRGLSLGEVGVLLATKKAQWGMGLEPEG